MVGSTCRPGACTDTGDRKQEYRVVKPKVGVLISGLAIAIAGGSGCASDGNKSKITQLPGFYGRRPGPIRPPSRYAQKPAPRAQLNPTAGWTPGRGISNRWKCIVIHHSASDKSTPQGMRDYHMRTRGWDELGYHFVIGNGVAYGDGNVFVGERWKRQMHGAHCKTPGNFHNNHGIGICLIGDLESHAPTARQIESLSRLLSFLSGKTRMPRSMIYTHGGVTNRTACPGRYFSLSNVLSRMSTRTVSASSR